MKAEIGSLHLVVEWVSSALCNIKPLTLKNIVLPQGTFSTQAFKVMMKKGSSLPIVNNIPKENIIDLPQSITICNFHCFEEPCMQLLGMMWIVEWAKANFVGRMATRWGTNEASKWRWFGWHWHETMRPGRTLQFRPCRFPTSILSCLPLLPWPLL